MYVKQRTWLEAGPRQAKRLPVPVMVAKKGMGSTDNCPSLKQLMGITDPSDPCQSGAPVASTSNGTPCYTNADGSINCAGVSSSVDVVAAGVGSGMCFSWTFPFVGSKVQGVCVPAIAVPSPWDTILTISVLGLIGYKLAQKVL